MTDTFKKLARPALRRGRHVVRAVRAQLVASPPSLPQTATARNVRKIRHFGFRHQCPICGSGLQKFLTSPKPYVRPEAVCPVCGCLEWYRFGWKYLTENHADLITAGHRVLHVAAEPEIRNQLNAVPGLQYNALDLDLRRATIRANLLQLPLTDGSVDLIYCSHVLEHVDDDTMAMRELRRVISARGGALLQVPITAEKSWGDPSITDPQERARLFGQFDHVRVYGLDVIDRLRDAGWNVEHVTVDRYSTQERRRQGLPQHEDALAAADIFWCTPA